MTPTRNLIAMFLVTAVTTSAVAAQDAPRVIAWQAPTGPGVAPPSGGCIANYNSAYWGSFTSTVLPKISGIGVAVYWDCVDDCSARLSGWNAPCAIPTATTCPIGTWDGNWEDCFDWGWLDADLQDYNNAKLVLIINPESDSGGSNGVTPQYVFTLNWASTVSASPQDVVVCQGWQGGTQHLIPSPITVMAGHSFGPSDFGIWNTNQCALLGTNLSCSCTVPPCNIQNFSGFPVVYETPIFNAYQNFLRALFKHYSSQGNATGQQIAPHILYARIGMSHGGENYPICGTRGALNSCNSSPCNNGGLNSTWPGPQGQFDLVHGEPWTTTSAYSDAGYLTAWPTSGDGTGYITAMLQFLNAKATFPVTIASSYGPPDRISQFYADLEAQLAAQNNVGFGNQVLNIYDTILAAAGTPSVDDWVANFKNYPYAPVHHLQAQSPGSTGVSAGFAVNPYIVYSGGTTATVNCTSGSGCNTLCPGPIYITGNDSPLLNGIFKTVSASMCAADTVTFTLTQFPQNGNYNNGIMWGPNYWPITMPFATQQKATSVEVWECDLDFAFGTTTIGGCANSLPSPSVDYENAVGNTLVGIPFGTSFHIASFYNGWQF